VLNVFKFRRDLALNVLVSLPDMYRLGINAQSLKKKLLKELSLLIDKGMSIDDVQRFLETFWTPYLEVP
jgi:hypothetical protein